MLRTVATTHPKDAVAHLSELFMADLTAAGYTSPHVQQEQAYAADVWQWCCEQVSTLDESQEAILPFPAHKAYLYDVFQALDECNKLAIPKSRDVMATWSVALWCLHRVRYNANNLVLWQSDTESKAAEVLETKCMLVEQHLADEWNKRPWRTWNTAGGLIGRARCQATQSQLVAIPHGSNPVRSYTYSVHVMDEADFQRDCHKALAATLPRVEKGAKLVLMSSSNGPSGVLASICREIGMMRF